MEILTNCYYCKEFEDKKVEVAVSYPFCNKSEHEKWSARNYPVTRGGKKDITYMQERLKEMALKAGTRVGENKKMFKEEDYTA